MLMTARPRPRRAAALPLPDPVTDPTHPRRMARAPRTRATALLAVLIVAASGLLSASPLPGSPPAAAAPGTDDEGGTAKLRKVLQAATKSYADAKAKLENSKKRQAQMNVQLRDLEARHAALAADVGKDAARAYRTGRLGTVAVLIGSSRDSFWSRATSVEELARLDAKRLRLLTESRQRVTAAKTQIQVEIAEQSKQLKIMAKRKQEAERALIEAGGGSASGGWLSANSALAKPAPRNSDGSWPTEKCNIDDPTTSGCITPRTLHAMQQAKAAGFNHYVSCYRSGGGGDHPRGHACDFAAAKNGFEDVNASGADRTYGNQLAAFFVKNADRLGVSYVIWYRQIWMPGSGWSSYSGGSSPAGSHTNHVHLSML